MRLKHIDFESAKYGLQDIFDSYVPKYLTKENVRKILEDKRHKILSESKPQS